MYGTQRERHARHFQIYYHKEQEEYNRAVGVEEI